MNRARNNGIYAAETILKQRTKDGKVWYLMKWKGYSPRFNTWEPEENVLDDRLLKAYRKRLAESKGKVKRKRSKPAEEEGNPSDEKPEVDVESVEPTTDATPEPTSESPSRDEMPSTSVEQPGESMKKWRKRRKINTDTPTEIQKDVPETNVTAEPSAGTSTTDETTEIIEDKETSVNDSIECSPEPKMTELSVEIPEEEHPPKPSPSPVLPAIEENIDSQEQQENSLENPIPSPTSLPVTSAPDSVPTATVSNLHCSPPIVSPKPLSPDNTVSTPEERKIDLKSTQVEKKNVLSKSSHFDFLANSIIITDVTTEKGTVTVKECSAYGDFFGPDLDKPQ